MGVFLHGVATDAPFVSTLAPTAAQRRTALLVALVSVLVFAAAAPFARVPLSEVDAFLPLFKSALIVFDLVTSVLLLGQYRIVRSRSLLILAAAFVFNALMAIAHALSFPDLFTPEGLLGGPQTTAWLYFLWHGGFPVFIVGYAFLKSEPAASPARTGPRSMLAFMAVAVLAAAALVWAATALDDWLPPIMNANTDAPGKRAVAVLTWLIGIAALVMLWARRPHSVLDMWLMVVLCVLAAETALAAVLNGARFDVGWYAGRIYALLGNGFVLTVLLLENSRLYAQLAESNLQLARNSRAMEDTLRELAQANHDLRSFAGSLAHDLQQPLTTIAAFSQVMQKDADKFPPADVAHLGKITAAAASARDMIGALLEFARLGEAELAMTNVDLNEVVHEARNAVAPAAESRHIEWRVSHLPKVRGDRSLLLLAFVNLLSNAVKYTRHKAVAAIAIKAEPHAGGTWAVRIRDNGVGFDMQHASRLFRPFERLHTSREFEGTGMGLANVRRIMERHGASISVESRTGEGTTFTVALAPAHEAG